MKTQIKHKDLAKKIAKEAYNKREQLIKKYENYEAYGSGNVSIKLSDGFEYLYGHTIKEPQILFPNGGQIHDMELFSKLNWEF